MELTGFELFFMFFLGNVEFAARFLLALIGINF
jgi:hypothetical protein